MQSVRPTKDQENQIQTTLMNLIGDAEYNEIFRILLCGEIIEGVAHVFVLNEFHALQAEYLYSRDIITAIGGVIALDVRAVTIWPLDFSDQPVDQAPNDPSRAKP